MKDDRQLFIETELRQLRARWHRADRWSWRALWIGTFIVWGAICWWVYIRIV